MLSIFSTPKRPVAKNNCPHVQYSVSFSSTKVFHGEHFSCKSPVPWAFYSLSTACGLLAAPTGLSTVIHAVRKHPRPSFRVAALACRYAAESSAPGLHRRMQRFGSRRRSRAAGSPNERGLPGSCPEVENPFRKAKRGFLFIAGDYNCKVCPIG